MPVSTRSKRNRRTRTASANGNGAGRVRSKRRAGTKSARPATAFKAQASAKPARPQGEMERSNPEFKAALKFFSAAAHHFRKKHYEKAQEFFEKVAASPARELAVRARVHLVLCAQKLEGSAPPLKSAEDFYDMGVTRLNARDLEHAIDYLSKADKAAPDREHIKYALASAHAIQGNTDVALEHLKVAIALRPGNRFQARYDDDFQPLASDPRFKRLVHGVVGQDS